MNLPTLLFIAGVAIMCAGFLSPSPARAREAGGLGFLLWIIAAIGAVIYQI